MIKHLNWKDFVVIAVALAALAYLVLVRMPRKRQEWIEKQQAIAEKEKKVAGQREAQPPSEPNSGDQAGHAVVKTHPGATAVSAPSAPVGEAASPDNSSTGVTPAAPAAPPASAAQAVSPTAQTTPKPAIAPVAPPPPPVEFKQVTVDTDQFQLVFSEDSGALMKATRLDEWTKPVKDPENPGKNNEHVLLLDDQPPFQPSMRVVDIVIIRDDDSRVTILPDYAPSGVETKFDLLTDPDYLADPDKWEGDDPLRYKQITFAKELADPKTGTYTGVRLLKVFTVYKDPPDVDSPSNPPRNHIDMDVIFQLSKKYPATSNRYRITYDLIGAGGMFPDGSKSEPIFKYAAARFHKVTIGGFGLSGKFEKKTRTAAKLLKTIDEPFEISLPNTWWVATQNRFFCVALITYDPASITSAGGYIVKNDQPHGPAAGRRLSAKQLPVDKRYMLPYVTVTDMRSSQETLQLATADGPARIIHHRYALYMGPESHSLLKSYSQHLTPVNPATGFGEGTVLPNLQLHEQIRYSISIFDWLARFLLSIFRGIHYVVGNYGLAVIIMTIAVRLVLLPLQKKSIVSMSSMQKLQPMVAAINYKYKNQKSPESQRKKQMEMMDLYRKHKVNPMMGCLPILGQIPVFFALYGMFSAAYPLRQAPFLWISDLSLPDRLAKLGLGFGPEYLNLLPIFYAAVMIVNALRAPKSADPNQDMSRKMGFIFPLVFMFIFYKMPAGLVLYFTVSATMSLLETTIIRARYVPKGDIEPPADLKKIIEKMNREKQLKSGGKVTGPTLDISEALK